MPIHLINRWIKWWDKLHRKVKDFNRLIIYEPWYLLFKFVCFLLWYLYYLFYLKLIDIVIYWHHYGSTTLIYGFILSYLLDTIFYFLFYWFSFFFFFSSRHHLFFYYYDNWFHLFLQYLFLELSLKSI